MSRFLAWHLPQLEVRESTELVHTSAGAVLAPALGAQHIESIAARLVATRTALHDAGTDRIVEAIDHVAGRFLDDADPLRAQALDWLPAVTGYGERMTRLVLDRMAADWTKPALRRLLRAELRDPRVLDGFVRHAPGQRVHAVGPRLALHILAGNVPGVGVTSLVRSLLVRAPALCKTARGEPVLPVLFARALHEFDAALGSALAVAYWPGDGRALLDAALAAADTVIHYGSGDALAETHRRLPPHVRLLEHGPRVSFAMVARERNSTRTALAAALALATFDQQGCVSPHVLYVEAGGRRTQRRFAGDVASALASLAAELPRGRLDPAEAAAIQQLRAEVEFRAMAGEDMTMWAGDDLAFTVIYHADPAFAAAPLNRTIWIKPVADLADVPALLGNAAPLVQTAALAAPAKRTTSLAPVLALAGITRITSLSAMPWPPASWHHDGRGPLRELLHFCDLEQSSK